jgi:hypothetical protein
MPSPQTRARGWGNARAVRGGFFAARSLGAGSKRLETSREQIPRALHTLLARVLAAFCRDLPTGAEKGP